MKMNNFLIYLAGPISGLSYSGCTEWRELVKEQLPSYIQSLSPMRGKLKHLRSEEAILDTYEEHPLTSEKGINARDEFDVRRSDVILFNLLGAKTVSIGTMFELAWAKLLNIPTVVVMEKEGNIHEHAFVRDATSFRTDNLENAIHLITVILGPDKNLDY